jgi:branched-chain amino acid transport system permease protein
VSILRGLSFAINQPGIHCIIGPNGAGKTSIFNVMTGQLPALAGRIMWRRRALQNRRPFVAAELGVGRKLQVPSIFPSMTIGQNLDIALWANRLRAADLLSYAPCHWTTSSLNHQLAHFPFLTTEDMPAGRLSVGQRQMLDFAMTMLAEPALVLLDEPCAGLSTGETEKMIEVIAAMAARTEALFVIIEHDMQVVERLSDHVIVMHQGALLASGTMQEVKANEAVRQVYAGGTK